MKRVCWSRVWAGFACAAVLLVLPLAASAADGDPDFRLVSIGPRLNFTMNDDAEDGQLFLGAQARFQLQDNLALEASLDYARQTYEAHFTSTDVTMYPVQISLLGYFMPGENVNPYLLGGVGWYYTEVDGVWEDTSDHRFGLHAGVGVEFNLNRQLALDCGYRYVYREDFESRDLTFLEKEYSDSGSMLTVGLSFKF